MASGSTNPSSASFWPRPPAGRNADHNAILADLNPRPPGRGRSAMSQIDLPAVPRIARLVEWKPWNGSASLIGHCSVAFAGGWVVHKVPVFRTKDGGLAAGTPSAAQIGTVKTKPDGGRSYENIISFQGPEARERWQSAVLTALADAG